jgi:hypothetical protein
MDCSLFWGIDRTGIEYFCKTQVLTALMVSFGTNALSGIKVLKVELGAGKKRINKIQLWQTSMWSAFDGRIICVHKLIIKIPLPGVCSSE